MYLFKWQLPSAISPPTLNLSSLSIEYTFDAYGIFLSYKISLWENALPLCTTTLIDEPLVLIE